MKDTPSRTCQVCGKKYFKKPSHSKTAWPRTKYCSQECFGVGMVGKEPYNKGKKMRDLLPNYKHPMFGKSHTEKTKEKIKVARAKQEITKNQLEALERGREALRVMRKKKRVVKRCAVCGKEMILSPSRAIKKTCSAECYGKYQSLYRRGKLAAAYIHGNGQDPYKGFTEELKNFVRKRDGYRCQMCGVMQEGVELSVHHIDYDKDNPSPENLISLCVSCHAKTNRDRQQWINYFRNV